jgi:uncharacterized membrane protein
MKEGTKASSKGVNERPGVRLLSGLSYAGILFVIPLLAARDSKFAQFHVRQGIVLFIADVAASFIVWVPFVGWSLGIAMFIVSFYGFLQALRGEEWELPYLGQYAKKINL